VLAHGVQFLLCRPGPLFGAIFSGVLAGDIAAALHGMPLPSGISASGGASPAVLEHLAAAIRDGYIAGFAQALHTVFLDATPVGAVAFLLSLTLKEVQAPGRRRVQVR
jgi:hypothetical protein